MSYLFKFCCVFLLLISSVAVADDMRPSSLIIQQSDVTEFQATWKRPIKKGVSSELVVAFDDATEHQLKRQYVIDNYDIAYWTFTRANRLDGLSIEINGFLKSAEDVILRLSKLNGDTETRILNKRSNSYLASSSENLSLWQIGVQYIYLGIEHILIGLDHLLFIACLVYISRTPRKLFWTITGFTLAHSITLTLAATETFMLPIAPVEAAIALSIVFLAAEIAKNKQHSLSLKYPVLVSSSFGLLHGFGFASVLADIGLPAQANTLALLGFNIGVEIGQLLFVAALVGLFYLLKLCIKSLSAENARLPMSYLCGCVGSIWVLERLAAF